MGDYYNDAYRGASDLGSALSGVGGLEGYRAQMLQKMADEAAMERLQKEYALKQQMEDAAEQKRQAQIAILTRLMHGLTAGRSPGMDPNQYGPDSPTPGGQLDYPSINAAYASLSPAAGASNFDDLLKAGVFSNPAFNLEKNKADAEVRERGAHAGLYNQEAGYYGQKKQTEGENTRWAKSRADHGDEYWGNMAGAVKSLGRQRDAAADLSGAKQQTVDATRQGEVDKLKNENDLLLQRGKTEKERTDLVHANIEKAKDEGRISKEEADYAHAYYEARAQAMEAERDRKKESVNTQRNETFLKGKQGEKAEQEAMGAQNKVGRDEIMADLKQKGQEATNKLLGIKGEEEQQKLDEAKQSWPARLNKMVSDLNTSMARTALYGEQKLTQEQQTEIAKVRAEKIESELTARIKDIEAGTKLKEKNTEVGQQRAEYLKKLARKTSIAISHAAVSPVARAMITEAAQMAFDPKASQSVRNKGMQQLSQMLQDFPDVDVVPGKPAEGFFGQATPPQIRLRAPSEDPASAMGNLNNLANQPIGEDELLRD